MKLTSYCGPPRKTPRDSLKSALLLLSLAAAGTLTAQTIPNPGFEADTFTEFPGYVSGNTEITGWTGEPADNYGLNPTLAAPPSPFADNGVVPEGTNVAFIQSQTSGIPTEMRTEITGLTPNTEYRLSFRANARADSRPPGQQPVLSVTVGDNTLLTSNIIPVRGANPYHFVYVDFTASAATETLVLRNEVTAENTDTTVLVDDFTIGPVPAADPAWSQEEWYDDETSGVDARYEYTHAYSFGSGTGAVINGVSFKGIAGGSPAEAGKFTVTGSEAVYNNDENEVFGEGSDVLANDFIYNGNPGVLTLQGLTPNTPYLLTLYSVGWEGIGGRFVNFSSGNSRFFTDQDSYDNNNGIRIVHTYTSSAEGTAEVSFRGLGGTFHLYGFSNRETTPRQADSAPVFNVHPQGVRALTGQTVTLSAGASGFPVPTYQWLRNGQPVQGATGITIEIIVDGAAQAGLYTLQATNAAGTATSGGAYLEVLEPVTGGPLFSTGVDAAGAAEPGTEDPHYTVFQNPAADPEFPALVHTAIPAGAWLENTDTSQWIGATSNGNDAVTPGNYVFRTVVDLTGLNKDTAELSGFWASDDTGLQIRVNGQAVTGLSQSAAFNAWTWFSINTANAPSLVAGANTVDFVVNNAPGPVANPNNPGGLRVQATRVPEGIAPVIVEAPRSTEAAFGETVVLTVRGYGSGALSYEWSKDGAVIPNVTGPALTLNALTAASAGSYTVKAISALGASAASAPAAVRVMTVVPGTGSTGIAADGTPLPDGAEDPRYILVSNPSGDNDLPAVVHNSGVPGAWLANSATSKWISPLADTIAAAAGSYVYRTTIDLTGFDPASAVITGAWSSDNAGQSILVNGTATGLSIPGNFGSLTPFRIDASNANFVSGVNTLEFTVQNADPGYTALRVDGLRVLANGGSVAPPGDLPELNIRLSANAKPVVSFTGTAGAAYIIQRSTALSSWQAVGDPITAPAGGQVEFEDANAPAGRAFYRVVAPAAP